MEGRAFLVHHEKSSGKTGLARRASKAASALRFSKSREVQGFLVLTVASKAANTSTTKVQFFADPTGVVLQGNPEGTEVEVDQRMNLTSFDVLACKLGLEENSKEFLITTKSGESYTYRVESAEVASNWVKKIIEHSNIRPVVVVVGETGTGKSLFCTALSGLPVSNSTFTVANSVVSVTNETRAHDGTWFGSGDPNDSVVVIDTPGLNDTDGRDDAHIVGMMRELMERAEVHCFAIVLNSQDPRLSASLLRMLRLFENQFGKGFWQVATIVFTRWYTDEASVDRREKSEEDMKEEWGNTLASRFPAIKKLQGSRDLPFTFVDSMAIVNQKTRKDIRDRAMEEFRIFSLTARTNRPHLIGDGQSSRPKSWRASLGRPKVAREPSLKTVEAMTQENIFHEFLVKRDLAKFEEMFIEQGIATVKDLRAMQSNKELLRKFFGMTDVEIARIAGEVAKVAPQSEDYNVLVQGLKKFKVPHAKFAEKKIPVKDALQLTDQELIQEYGCNALKVINFHRWKQSFMAGAAVYGPRKVVWVGALVERNASTWNYDSDGDSDDEDTIPQDGATVGEVLGWHTVDGDKEGGEDAPKYKGWVRVRWMSSGYKRTYRMGAEGVFDLRYVLNPEVYESDSGLFGVPLEGVTKLLPKHLRRTFKYPVNMRYSHKSTFDIREEVLQKFGVKHGDVVRLKQMPLLGLFQVIGVRPGSSSKVQLHFQNLADPSTTGAGVMGNLELNEESFIFERREQPVRMPVGYHDDGYESEDEIDNDEIADIRDNLEPTFDYVIGVAKNCEMDIREEVIQRMVPKLKGLRHGTVVYNANMQKEEVCIGVGKVRNKVAIFFHVDGSPGAGINVKMPSHLSRYKIIGERRPEPRKINIRPAPTEDRLRSIVAELQCDFPFPKGIRGDSQGMFDTRDVVCNELYGYPSGTAFVLPSGEHLTIVGPTVETENGVQKAVLWYHMQGHGGAGTLPIFHEVCAGFTKHPQKVDLRLLGAQLTQANQPQMNPMAALLGLMLAGGMDSNSALLGGRQQGGGPPGSGPQGGQGGPGGQGGRGQG